jgi:hypothetical protein
MSGWRARDRCRGACAVHWMEAMYAGPSKLLILTAGLLAFSASVMCEARIYKYRVTETGKKWGSLKAVYVGAIDDGRPEPSLVVLDGRGRVLTASGVLNDPGDFSQGPAVEITVITAESLRKLIDARGLPDESLLGLGNLEYAYRESKYTSQQTKSGRLDFGLVGTGICQKLCLMEGVLYNGYDFGNLLWGRGMAKLGFPYVAAKVGSEINAFLWTYDQNGSLAERDGKTGKGFFQRLMWTGDSPADQRAIYDGYTRKNSLFSAPKALAPADATGAVAPRRTSSGD